MSVEVLNASIRARSVSADNAVIDVDDFDDEIQFMGMRGPIRRRRRESYPDVELLPDGVQSAHDARSQAGPSNRRANGSLPPRHSNRAASAQRHLPPIRDHFPQVDFGHERLRRADPPVYNLPQDGPRPIERTYAWIANMANGVFRHISRGGAQPPPPPGPPANPDDALENAEAMLRDLLTGENLDVAATFLTPMERLRYVLGARGRGGYGLDVPRPPDYKPEFTHAIEPGRGFAFDFAVEPLPKGTSADDPMIVDGEDEDAMSNAPSGPLPILCARCDNHLHIDGGGEMNDAKRQLKRVWALRCGHMVDGVCLHIMMQPVLVPAVDMRKMDRFTVLEVKGKGKTTNRANGKGKSKATEGASSLEIDDDDELLLKPTAEDTETPGRKSKRQRDSDDMVISTENVLAAPSDMRSRLRPRASMTSSAPGFSYAPSSSRTPRRVGSSAFASFESDTTVTNVAPVATPSRRAARLASRPSPLKPRAKGKGRARANRVEAEHNFFCPVPSCHRQHSSQLIGGVWVQHPARGAVAMYV